MSFFPFSCVNPPNMDDEDTNDNCLTIDTSLQIPIIKENDKLLSSLSSNISMQISKTNSDDGDEENHLHLHEDNSSSHPDSESNQSQSPQTISSIVLDTIINQIELENSQFNSLPIVEDDQIEPDDDDEDEEDNEEDEEETEEQENPDKSSTNKTIKIEKERSNIRSTSVKGDSKPMTRTLRSHARTKINLIGFNSSSSNANNNNTRRVSSRRRALDSKLLLVAHEKERKRKTMIDRSRKDKESVNDDNHTSSNSDDQTMETTHGKNSRDLMPIVFLPS